MIELDREILLVFGLIILSLLTLWRIYQVIPDESAAKSNYLRLIDDEGKDYFYPADYCIDVEFTPEVEQALLKVKI